VLDWTALGRDPHKAALERAKRRFAVRRRELAPRLPGRAPQGTLLGPATLTACWSLADGATLRLAANLSAAPFPSPPALCGRRLLATAATHGSEWPPWYVEWALDD
jgi:hypothetical protein